MAARSTTFRKIFSLVLIRDFENNKILLGYKKRGFGANKWNGFGGKLDKSETILECAKRELKEESGLDANEIKKIGYLEFEFENKNEILEAHIFESNKFSGEIEETEEMLPKWFDINQIPFDSMWADDRYWFPMFLDHKKFKGHFLFKNDEETIIKHNLEIVDNFE